MSQENVEVVRIYATGCWDSGGDPVAALEYLHKDFEFVNPPHAVLPSPRYGHQGFVAAMENPARPLTPGATSRWHSTTAATACWSTSC
jgi:hypothetical protein